MNFQWYAHRFADIILNSDYQVKREIEEVLQSVSLDDVRTRFDEDNQRKIDAGRKPSKGMQSTINILLKDAFISRDWESEKNVFNDPTNDLAIDFWKREVGVDVAFNHRSFIGGDLLRLQAAAEVMNIDKVGVYICPTREFANIVSANDASSMVNFERAKWYLEKFYPVLTAPILLIGLTS